MLFSAVVRVARLSRHALVAARPVLLIAAFVWLGRAGADENLETLICKQVESSKKFATRVNGVKLDATVEVIRAEDSAKKDRRKNASVEHKIAFHWTLDYDGPRQPLIILTPSLELPTSRQTWINFHALGSDSKSVILPFFSLLPRHPVRIDPAFFTTIPQGKKATGTIEVSGSSLLEALHSERATKVVPFPPRAILARLRHEPFDRGRDHNLDAWTGFLQTKFLRIPLNDLRDN